MVLIMCLSFTYKSSSKMLEHASFFLSCFLLMPLAFSSVNPPGICSSRCGNLEIPYPFGIGSSCSLNPFFEIHCNTSTNPPKAYLYTTDLEIIEFNPSQIRVRYPNLALTCYDSSNNVTERSDFKIDLSSTPFSLSDTNWLTAIGCDDFVTVLGNTKESYGSGCLSFCSEKDDSVGGYGYCQQYGNVYFPSTGCCRIPIPIGTNVLSVTLSDSHQNWRKNKFFPCSYAFVVGYQDDWLGSEFFYRMEDLHNSTSFLNRNPMITRAPLLVDWGVGNESCTLARRNSTTFACRANNSFCIDSWTTGYFCMCSDGYEGNPYLINGCQDIDECRTASNPCVSCINTPGSYKCTCPKGYNGDGRIDGSGCRWSPSKIVIVSIGVGVGIGSLLLFSICFWLHKVFNRRANKKRREKFFKRNGGLLLQQQTTEGTLGKTNLFPAKELEKATDNFNQSRILGQGGQGTVYKGMLSDGQIVAIKKAKKVDEDQLEQFINEVAILSQINHRNVVKILGCCLETEVPLLVYEFVPNGTLFHLIHDPNSGFLLSWNMRLKIAADIAGALAYLHSSCSLPIYHRDIKTSNILLDEKYVVKVSDFGTSKSVTIDQTHVTTLVKGTFGYLDPEYFRSGQFTEKSDVYSFAVVLIELLTGQRAVSSSEERGLAARFLESMEMDGLDEILDDQFSEEGKKEEVVAVARLAQRCLNLQGKMRPSMKEVAIELETIIRMSQMAATLSVEDGIQQVGVNEDEMMMLSDFEFSWTTSGKSVASSSSDCHPLMFETV